MSNTKSTWERWAEKVVAAAEAGQIDWDGIKEIMAKRSLASKLGRRARVVIGMVA